MDARVIFATRRWDKLTYRLADKVEIAGPGFLYIFLKRWFFE